MEFCYYWQLPECYLCPLLELALINTNSSNLSLFRGRPQLLLLLHSLLPKISLSLLPPNIFLFVLTHEFPCPYLQIIFLIPCFCLSLITTDLLTCASIVRLLIIPFSLALLCLAKNFEKTGLPGSFPKLQGALTH